MVVETKKEHRDFCKNFDQAVTGQMEQAGDGQQLITLFVCNQNWTVPWFLKEKCIPMLHNLLLMYEILVNFGKRGVYKHTSKQTDFSV